MADDSMNQALLEALEGIQAELARINKTLSSLSAQKSKPASDGEYSAPRGRVGGYRSDRRSEGPASGGVGAEPRTFRPSRPATGAGPARKGPKVRSGPAPKKPLPPKKGNGYPKKPN